MFKRKLKEYLGIGYYDYILVRDLDRIEERYPYSNIAQEHGYKVLYYVDATHFRYFFEMNKDKKIFVVTINDVYIPYDVLTSFYVVELRWNTLFPNVDRTFFEENKDLELDFVYPAFVSWDWNQKVPFTRELVFEKNNANNYIRFLLNEIGNRLAKDRLNYKEWIDVAKLKSRAEYIAARIYKSIDVSFVEERFKTFVLEKFQMLSSILDSQSPVLVSHVMDFIASQADKIALIVMDGMSVFDFMVLKDSLRHVEYFENYIYAMIPTTTSISRQCLLSGKFPIQLDNMFGLSREEHEFKNKCIGLGFKDREIVYHRGYDVKVDIHTKIVAVIIDDIDNLVHSQRQGRIGMYHDVANLGKTQKIEQLIVRLHRQGFKVFITSDHGNTPCRGLGILRGAGVEVETKSRRMLILKDFADSKRYIERYNMIRYPGYYLDKKYQYLICDTGTSLDAKDTLNMNHGGFSIDEVIVPFISVKDVSHND